MLMLSSQESDPSHHVHTRVHLLLGLDDDFRIAIRGKKNAGEATDGPAISSGRGSWPANRGLPPATPGVMSICEAIVSAAPSAKRSSRCTTSSARTAGVALDSLWATSE